MLSVRPCVKRYFTVIAAQKWTWVAKCWSPFGVWPLPSRQLRPVFDIHTRYYSSYPVNVLWGRIWGFMVCLIRRSLTLHPIISIMMLLDSLLHAFRLALNTTRAFSWSPSSLLRGCGWPSWFQLRKDQQICLIFIVYGAMKALRSGGRQLFRDKPLNGQAAGKQ